MGNIVRVITKDRVYSIGQRLPVPEGYPVEPFFISVIQTVDDDEGNELIEFTCTPDEEASDEVGSAREPGTTDELWEALQAYRNQARQAVELKWLVLATIPRNDARIEMIITAEEYVQMQTVQESDMPDVVEQPEQLPEPEVVAETTSEPLTPTSTETEAQPLPDVLAVNTSS